LRVFSIDVDKNELTLIDKDNQEVIWNLEKYASKNVEVYNENQREIRIGEELFWRRSGGTKDNKRHTNEKIKILNINRFSKSVKYVDLETAESQSMRLKDFENQDSK
jgi:uncharacterized protein YcfL